MRFTGYGVGLRVEKRVTEKESRGESQVERRGEGNRFSLGVGFPVESCMGCALLGLLSCL